MVLILGQPLIAGLGTEQSGLFIRSRVIVAGSDSDLSSDPPSSPPIDTTEEPTVPVTPTGSFI